MASVEPWQDAQEQLTGVLGNRAEVEAELHAARAAELDKLDRGIVAVVAEFDALQAEAEALVFQFPPPDEEM